MQIPLPELSVLKSKTEVYSKSGEVYTGGITSKEEERDDWSPYSRSWGLPGRVEENG